MKSKIRALDKGDPPQKSSGIFGGGFTYEESKIIILSVPWEGTASGHKGTAKAPQAILKASHQLDLFDYEFDRPYKAGIYMINDLFKEPIEYNKDDKDQINDTSELINKTVYTKSKEIINSGKILGLLGGEHSIGYGLVKALCEKLSFGILHIDSHHDLRPSYEGYKYSHASTIYNIATDFPSIKKIVSIGIRDFSFDEFCFANEKADLIKTYYDQDIFIHKQHGESLDEIFDSLELPENIYISFDIDGLEPSLSPSTGTPVPGGFSFNEISYLLGFLVKYGHKIIGFDLCEVCPGENAWDENVGARILYKLCGAAGASNNLYKFTNDKELTV